MRLLLSLAPIPFRDVALSLTLSRSRATLSASSVSRRRWLADATDRAEPRFTSLLPLLRLPFGWGHCHARRELPAALKNSVLSPLRDIIKRDIISLSQTSSKRVSMNDALSTTKLLRTAHDIAGGNIGEAMDHLRHLSAEHANATNAIGVLRMKLQKHPGASTFSFGSYGFVKVA